MGPRSALVELLQSHEEEIPLWDATRLFRRFHLEFSEEKRKISTETIMLNNV